METTTYYARVLKNDWQLALDILSDIFLNSTLDEGELDRERDVISAGNSRFKGPAG